MKSERPVTYHCRQAHDSSNLLRDVYRRRPCKEVEVKDSSQGIILEILAGCVVDLDVHAVGVEEEHTVGAIFSPMVEIDGVIAVQIGSSWNAICIS
jgi:hypothetical protein